MARLDYARPSSAGTWGICTGNIDMRAMFPAAPEDGDSEVAEDGTACHWLAAELFNGNKPVEGTLAPNGRVLTEEMFDASNTYLRVINGWPNVAPVCEKFIPIPRIFGHTYDAPRGGTPDAWAYDPSIKTLYVADLKFGFRFVEVWDNDQLICYVAGLMDLLGLDWNTTRVVLTIVQPRSPHREGPVRTWRIKSAASLLPRIEWLASRVVAATEYVPNPGCLDCPGRHVCTTLHNSALRAVEFSGTSVPHELSPQALGFTLLLVKDAVKKLTALESGLETQADALMRSGTKVPGWSLKASFSRETWREGTEAAIITLGHILHKNLAKPLKAITPNQARAAGMPPNLVDLYAHKPSTGVRLTKTDPYEARKAFDND